MRHLWICCLSVVLCIADPAVGDNRSDAKATQRMVKRSTRAVRFREPDGFLGLKFGVPLESQLHECNHRVYGEQPVTAVFCYTNLSTGRLGYPELEQPPHIGVAYSAVALLVDGSVEDICLRFRNEDFPQMVKLLVARFRRGAARRLGTDSGTGDFCDRSWSANAQCFKRQQTLRKFGIAGASQRDRIDRHNASLFTI